MGIMYWDAGFDSGGYDGRPPPLHDGILQITP
jgi:hypothetical protein